ncbi:30S ribosomal protein S20 [Patescibacteria group bacterium]|nr:30S ribosomal protein S20 [Patescibacteria group bacterium]
MPITKQVIKRMKQSRAKYARNKHYSSDMKSLIKLILEYIKKGEADKATKIQSKVVKAIDTAAKKNLIHKNNAAHKKSRIQKALNSMGESKPKTEKVEKKSAKKVTKKEEKAEKK